VNPDAGLATGSSVNCVAMAVFKAEKLAITEDMKWSV
jgi:hypothetical protein